MDVTSRSNRQPLKVPSSSPPGSPAATTLILIAVVAALYLGQELLIPLALSILLSFALAPFAIRLRRLGLGRIPSVLLLVVLVFVVVMAFGSLVTSEIASLAQNAGRYEYNFRTKIRTLGEATSNGGAFSQLRRLWVDIDRELERAARPSPDPSGTGARASAGAVEPVKPMPVEVHTPPARPIDLLGQFAGGLLKPLATAGVIVVFVVFFLLQREDLRDRFIRLFGSPLRQRDGEDGRDGGPIVLCLGARNALDDAASAMLAHLLRARGFGARLLPHGSLGTAPSIDMDGTGIDAIAVCCVQSEAKHHARRLIRRLRNSLPSRPPIVLMLSKAETPEEGWREASETAGADRVSVSLSGAVRELEGIIQSSRSLPTPNEAG